MIEVASTLSTLLLAQIWQFHSVRATPTDYKSPFHVDILRDPAPPPDQGPPGSAGALRDRSKLKYEITGIALSYVVFTGVILSLLFTVGKRRRRSSESSNRTLDMEMVKPSVNQAAIGVKPSPVASSANWPSPTDSDIKPWASPTGNHYYHYSQTSVSTFDDKVIETDKARNQSEMERLYAAVMAHDEEKESRLASPPKSPAHYPPELQHLRSMNGSAPPAQQPELAPAEPKSPTHSRASSRLTKASPLSFFQSGHSRASSAASNKQRPRRISIRELPISPPLGTPDLVQSVAYNDEQPLTPRLYTPGPPPLTPGQKSAAASAREAERKPAIRAGPPPAIRTRPNGLPDSSLPFRQNYGHSLQSAPPTKTTFVERRESLLHPGPKTGVPVPYSPYMPYTPVTPITPGRLVTKEDRKKNKKQGGLKVLAENDMVKSDDDVWGDSWKGR